MNRYPVPKRGVRFVAWAAILAAPVMQADTLSVGNAAGEPGGFVSLPFQFSNTHQIVGMQFDLHFPASQVEVGAAATASATTNHKVESRILEPGRRRIVVFSTTNQLVPDDLFLEVPLSLTATAPAGGPTVTITDILLTDKLARRFTPVLAYPKLDDWRRANFTAEDLEDPTIVGDDRDPDSDGVTNLGEYLGGTKPKTADAPSTPELASSQFGGVPYLTLTWWQDKTAAGAEARPAVSGTLSEWSESGVATAPTGTENAQFAEWRATVERVGDRQFLRLNFKRTTP